MVLGQNFGTRSCRTQMHGQDLSNKEELVALDPQFSMGLLPVKSSEIAIKES